MHMDETREDKFRRLAQARVNRCLSNLKLVGNLSAKGYASTPEQVDSIFSALRGSLDAAEASFTTKSEGPLFTL